MAEGRSTWGRESWPRGLGPGPAQSRQLSGPWSRVCGGPDRRCSHPLHHGSAQQQPQNALNPASLQPPLIRLLNPECPLRCPWVGSMAPQRQGGHGRASALRGSGLCSPLLHGPHPPPFFRSSLLHTLPDPAKPPPSSVLTRPQEHSLSLALLQMKKLRPRERGLEPRPSLHSLPSKPLLPLVPEPRCPPAWCPWGGSADALAHSSGCAGRRRRGEAGKWRPRPSG